MYYIPPEEAINMIKSIDGMPDVKVYELLQDYYGAILYRLQIERSKVLRFLYTNHKFLTVLNQVLEGAKIDEEAHRVCNAFLYDALVWHAEDKYTRKLIFILGKTINEKVSNELEDLGFLDRELCTFLAITFKSSYRDFTAITRLNFTLCTSSYINLTVDQVIKIYYVLAKKSITNSFIYTMLSTYVEDLADKNEECVNEMAIRNNDVISLAMCYILESLDPASISKILRSYYEHFKYKKHTRKSIPKIIKGKPGFVKIPIIIDELKAHKVFIV